MTEIFLKQTISYAGSVSLMKEFRDSVERQHPAVLNDKSGNIKKIFNLLIENLQKNEMDIMVEMEYMETAGE